jgi:hypothetical protein
MDIIKYPRTRHVSGSRLQSGDHDLSQVPIESLYGKHLVIEEKIDGASSGISFDSEINLHLQSRGHFLHGGPRESQFTLLKQWAAMMSDDLYLALGDRYVAYGEWMYRKHTVFYDALTHYWAEFDVLDKRKTDYEAYRANGFDSKYLHFLDTPSRQKLFQGLQIAPVRVLWSGIWNTDMRFEDFVGRSNFKTENWRENLKKAVQILKFDWDLVWKHTDHSDAMEGVYIKWEEDGIVKDRYKFVRHDFVSLIVSNDEHHENLPTVPNKLAEGVDIFAL